MATIQINENDTTKISERYRDMDYFDKLEIIGKSSMSKFGLDSETVLYSILCIPQGYIFEMNDGTVFVPRQP